MNLFRVYDSYNGRIKWVGSKKEVDETTELFAEYIKSTSSNIESKYIKPEEWIEVEKVTGKEEILEILNRNNLL